MNCPLFPSGPPDGSSNVPHGDPFDRPHQTHFQEPIRLYVSTASSQRLFESATSLPSEFGGQDNYSDDEYVEKLPLTAGENVGHAGGFYPPGYV
jgi:chitin synthase